MKTFQSIKVPITNNGGFGGGGYGSADGGAGGGGGYSGGGGGTADGFSGGGGSLNNGFRQKNEVTNLGNGYVRISFIGQQCCGPVDVYIAMAFIAGILSKLGNHTTKASLVWVVRGIGAVSVSLMKAFVQLWNLLGLENYKTNAYKLCYY